MPSFFALLAPLALLFPAPAGQDAGEEAQLLPDKVQVPPAEPGRREPSRWLALDATTSIPIQHQVRIERRLTIRISPRTDTVRQNMVAELSRPRAQSRFVERAMGNCVPMRSIAAVQSAANNRLVLYLRDQRIISASLEKACRARDFYSGFYVEPSDDGMLCIDRDRLLSRTGAKCQLSAMRRLELVTE